MERCKVTYHLLPSLKVPAAAFNLIEGGLLCQENKISDMHLQPCEHAPGFRQPRYYHF